MALEICPFCGKRAYITNVPDFYDVNNIICPICGNYEIVLPVTQFLVFERKDKFYLVSGYLRNYFINNNVPFKIENIDKINEIIELYDKKKSPLEYVDSLILYIYKQSEFYADAVEINLRKDYSIFYLRNSQYLEKLIDLSVKMNFIDYFSDERNHYNLTIQGWDRADELRQLKPEITQAFVAMNFNDSLKEIYDTGIKKAIEDAGYRSLRLDEKEHNGKIDNEIIYEIRNSAFVVADFTNPSNKIYFEASFAMGLKLPVIWMCREDALKNAHFDTNHFNHIVWENGDDLYKQLYFRIKATIIKN